MELTQSLEDQIRQLQSQIQPTVLKKVENVEEQMRRVFREEMSKLSTSLNQNVVASVNPMLAALGSALSEEEQTWISQPENQDKVTDFFKTAEGQAITRRFMMSYKEYKCK
jgi:ethanolamine utilization protein EutQ (cupin superfamily)